MGIGELQVMTTNLESNRLINFRISEAGTVYSEVYYSPGIQ